MSPKRKAPAAEAAAADEGKRHDSVTETAHCQPSTAMFLLPDMLLAMQAGPPPRSVLNKLPLWFLLLALLCLTMILRVSLFDILGSVVCGLLAVLAAMLIRDGMKELPKFGLPFGLLCGVNLLLYSLPTLDRLLHGRSERRVRPVSSVTHSNVHQFTYTLSESTKPFFDRGAGVLYNLQSIAMILMPLTMLLGAYLGMNAHFTVQRESPSLMRTQREGAGRASGGLLPRSRQADAMEYGSTPASAEPAPPARDATVAGVAPSGVSAVEHAQQRAFEGVAHKL